MAKLVILTTALTRGNYHENSIGKLYKSDFFKSIKHSNIHHIINIDAPNKLSDKFSTEQTVNILSELIPKRVNVELITGNKPSFLGAYKNVVNKAAELGLNNDNNVFWWLEDDWEYLERDFDVLKLCMELCTKSNVAINSVGSTPLGSFRGGPIMSTRYFNEYFNIEGKSVMNNTCDPERQISRWLSGIDRANGKKRIHRDVSNNKNVQIIYVCLKDTEINVDEIPHAYYANPSKFNKELNFTYHAVKISDDFTEYQYSEIDIPNKSCEFKNIDKEELFNKFNGNNINHVSLKPWSFSDIGRKFNEDNNLTKWTTINDNTTYV